MQRNARRLARAPWLACALVGACGPGDGSTLDERGRSLEHPYAPSLGSRFGSTLVEPSYEAIVLDLFEPHCESCHSGANPSEGLNLELEVGWDEMVDVPAIQRPSLRLVEPGAPERSYLVLKLTGEAGMSGRRMPRGQAARPPGEIDVVRQWIADGAARD